MEKCEECGAINNDFDECTHDSGFASSAASKLTRPFASRANDDGSDDFGENDQKSHLVWPYIVSPLGAVILDYLVPIWSTWYVSLIIVVLSFALINTVLNLFSSGTKVGFKIFLLSLARSIYAPGTIALRSNSGKAAMNIALWFGVVAASVLIVFSNVTTANANFLESKLKAEGLELTGQAFEISCPTGFTSGLPGSEIACSAKIIFGLSVPVKVQINGPFEPYTWKAGW
jgi:hypothetical protein